MFKRVMKTVKLEHSDMRTKFWFALQNCYADCQQKNWNFWINCFCQGENGSISAKKTLFITSDFKGLPADDREKAIIVDEVKVDSKDLDKFFTDCDDDHKVVTLSKSQEPNGKYIAILKFG